MTTSANRPSKITASDVLARYNESCFPDFCDPLTDVNQVGTFGNRPLHLASHHGNLEEITALIEGGADVNALGDMDSTPLHNAVERRHIDASRFLLAHGARLDIRNEFGRTPLDIAHLNGDSEMIALIEGWQQGH